MEISSLSTNDLEINTDKALYYVFHPSNPLNLVAELRGHRVNGHFKIEDITTRLNSDMLSLTPEDCQQLQIKEKYEVVFNKKTAVCRK